MHVAIAYRNWDAFRKMLAAGGDMSLQTRHGFNVMQYAVLHAPTDIVRDILDRADDILEQKNRGLQQWHYGSGCSYTYDMNLVKRMFFDCDAEETELFRNVSWHFACGDYAPHWHYDMKDEAAFHEADCTRAENLDLIMHFTFGIWEVGDVEYGIRDAMADATGYMLRNDDDDDDEDDITRYQKLKWSMPMPEVVKVMQSWVAWVRPSVRKAWMCAVYLAASKTGSDSQCAQD